MGERFSGALQSHRQKVVGRPCRFRRHQEPGTAPLAAGKLHRIVAAIERMAEGFSDSIFWRAGRSRQPRKNSLPTGQRFFPADKKSATGGGIAATGTGVFKRGHGTDARRRRDEGADANRNRDADMEPTHRTVWQCVHAG